MRRLVWASLVLALMLSTAVSRAGAQGVSVEQAPPWITISGDGGYPLPISSMPVPNTATWPVPNWNYWLYPPLSPSFNAPWTSSRPYFGPFGCPGDEVTAFALRFCGSLAYGPP